MGCYVGLDLLGQICMVKFIGLGIRGWVRFAALG